MTIVDLSADRPELIDETARILFEGLGTAATRGRTSPLPVRR
jgi:hypothetical protein